MRKSILLIILSVAICSCSENKKEKEQIKIGQTTTEIRKPQSELEKSIERGAIVYKDFCNQCHRPNGKGVGRSFPPLANSDYLFEHREASIRGIKYGQQGEITVNGKIYNGVMTPMGLSDQEVVDVMNYITNSWGNKSDKITTLEEVTAIEKE
ncbi:c-type cytochrome [Jejudonia soesokkakensis]|uniref:C-type cytochrome n=1 Tax=Jejudonia soesokkakensis TaxID=1323432 RepID=A0ABW2MWX1_9FLAO